MTGQLPHRRVARVGLSLAAAGAFWVATGASAVAAPLPVDLRDLPQVPLLFTGSGIAESVGAPNELTPGKSTETRCDLDGDGVDDLVAAAANWSIGDIPGGNQGRLYVIRGRAGWTGGLLPNTGETIAISGSAGNTYFGEDVVCAGDVDDDGIDDLAVGVGGNPAGTQKLAYLVYGAANLFTAGSFSIDDAGGRAVGFKGVNTTAAVAAPTRWAPLGDLDDDGHDDLALTSTASGLWVVPGRPRGEIADDAIDVSGPSGGYLAANGITYNYILEPVGDVDGDGTDDLAIGQYTANGAGGSQSGIVQIIGGGALDDPEAATFNVATEPAGERVLFRVHGPAAKASAGRAVAALGDVDGDGRDDIAIGVPGSRTTPAGEEPQIGKVFVLDGRTSHDPINLPNLGAASGYTITGLPGSADFGTVVEAADDLNGDGIADLLIGAPIYRNPSLPAGVTRTGAFFVVYGKTDTTTIDATNPTPTTGAAMLGAHFYHSLGASLATIADLDGNGLPELIAGGHPRPAPGKGELTVLRLGDPLPASPGPGPGNTKPTPDEKPKPKPKPLKATGDVTKTGRKGATTVALSKRPGAKANKAYRVKLVRKGKTIATGTVKGKTLKLQIRKVGKGKKARYPKLKGAYTLTGTKGVTGVTKTQLKIS